MAKPAGQAGAGRDLHDLLIAPLQAAFALPEVADGARTVSDDLHLDVPRAREVALGVDGAVAKGRQRLRLAARQRVWQVFEPVNRPRAATPAAGYRLEHDRLAGPERCHEGPCAFRIDRAVGAGQHGHTSLPRECARSYLVSEEGERLRARAHEGDALFRAAEGEIRVLAEESVARVNRVATVILRDAEDPFDVEVGRHPRAAKRISFVRPPGVERLGVVVRIHGDGPHAHLGGATDNADGDFAPVRNQQPVQVHNE